MANKHPVDRRENLIPFDNLSADEAREIRSKGGKARAEAIQRKKTFKEELLKMLCTVQGNGKTVQENGATALAKQLLKGDMSTWIFVRDTIGEKPADKVVVSGDIESVANDIGDFVDADRKAKKHD